VSRLPYWTTVPATDLLRYLLSKEPYLNDSPSKGNRAITRRQSWQIFRTALESLATNGANVPMVTYQNILREFPYQPER